MRSKILAFRLAFLIVFSMSCSFLTRAIPGGNVQKGFGAEATSASSVQLTWKPLDGAIGYHLDVRFGENDYIPVAKLPADQTSYEAFPVPDDSQMTYRLQAVTSSGTTDVGTVDVTTPAVTPNPLTVQANEYKPITWTPPTPDPNNPTIDPSSFYPPGFDPNDPQSFDPSALMQRVSASADIGVEGGEVTVTTPDKITYTLSVPAGALDDVTSIALVPIESIDSLPFSGGLLGAVRIEPEELVFDIPATLTITRADGSSIPSGMTNIAFTFEGQGQEFHLNPFASPDVYALNLGTVQLASLAAGPRFSGSDGGISIPDSQSYGAAAGTLQEARQVVQNNAPTDQNSNSQNAIAYAQAEDDLAPLTVIPDLAPIPSKFQIIDAALVKALNGVSWDDLKKSFSKLDDLERNFGKDPKAKAQMEAIWDALLDRLNNLLQHNKDKCLTRDDFDAHALVSQMMNSRRGTFGAEMGSRFKKKYGDTILKEISDSTKNCVLNLEISSRITADTPPVKFTTDVSGTIQNLKFKFARGKTYLTGKGELKYAPIQVIPKLKTSKDWCDPWEPLNDITVTVTVTRLEPIFYPRTAESEGGALKDFKLSFMPVDNGKPSFKTTCTSIDMNGKKQVTKQIVPLAYGNGSLWGGVFTASHMSELSTGGIWSWDVGNGPVYGSNIIDNPSFSPNYGTWSEHTEFIVIEKK